MEEFVDGDAREEGTEIHHYVAHLSRIELHACRILHPGISHQNPQCGNGGAHAGQPGCGKMETRAHTVPAKEHHSNKGCFHEEGQQALNGQGSAENIAHKPRVIAPVGAELKLKNQARGHANGEIDSVIQTFVARSHAASLCRI